MQACGKLDLGARDNFQSYNTGSDAFVWSHGSVSKKAPGASGKVSVRSSPWPMYQLRLVSHNLVALYLCTVTVCEAVAVLFLSCSPLTPVATGCAIQRD